MIYRHISLRETRGTRNRAIVTAKKNQQKSRNPANPGAETSVDRTPHLNVTNDANGALHTRAKKKKMQKARDFVRGERPKIDRNDSTDSAHQRHTADTPTHTDGGGGVGVGGTRCPC